MRTFWTHGERARLIELALRGDTWPSIALALGRPPKSCKTTFLQRATRDQIEQRKTKVERYCRKGPAINDGMRLAPDYEPFGRNAFRDVRTRDFGRAPMAAETRYSLTPTSIA